MKIKIFISYSVMNNKEMTVLKDLINGDPRLEAIVIPERKNPMMYFTEKVIVGIESCNYFVTIITKESIENPWVNQEIGYAMARNCKIIPIVLTQLKEELKGFINQNRELILYNESHSNQLTGFEKDFTTAAEDVVQYIIKANVSIDRPKKILDSPRWIVRGSNFTY